MAHGDITHTDIPVTDLEAGKKFYGTLFGWNIAEYPGFEGYPMWQNPNKVSGGGLMLRDGSLTQPRGYVEVDSIDDTLAKATEMGGSVVMPKTAIDETSWYAAFTDPDGNQLGLFEGMTGGGGDAQE